jgi:hypothetical protein
MSKFKIYCLSMSNQHLDKIKKLNYIPVALGDDNFAEGWIKDNTGRNISYKNKFYGENTFHYWLWKNNFEGNFDSEWIGFCHYRRFWLNSFNNQDNFSLKSSILQEIPKDWEKYDAVLGDSYYVNKKKLSKILKHGKKYLIKNPFFFFANKITVKVHFDMYHGHGNLDKAIDLLDNRNQDDFRKFVNSEISFNPFNMFFCRSSKILEQYYNSVFPWLERCEEIFGFDQNKNYGTIRIYAFLAERYLSYWFKKNTNYICWPIKHYDISNWKID